MQRSDDMINITRRVARLAGVTSLLAVIAIGLASPASAAAGDTSSFGIRGDGLLTFGPFAASAFPEGPATDDAANGNVAGLITTGVLSTTAHVGGASSTVNDLNVTLSDITTLTARTVSSQCTVDPITGGVSGDTTIVDGVITTFALAPITLNSSPAPDTEITVVDPAVASVVLNRQTTNPDDGTLTVDAIFITLLDGQTITIASSSCTPSGDSAIPMASGTGLALAGGLLGILILGYVIRRRSVSVPQAV